MADKNCPQPLGDNAMTISLSTYRTPTTTTFDSLFDSLFDPFFESVTIPRKRTASMVSTKVTTEDDKHIISILSSSNFRVQNFHWWTAQRNNYRIPPKLF